MKFTNPKGWTGRFTLCPGYSLLNFLDERVFSLNDSDVRLDLDSAGSFCLFARDAGELGDTKLKPSKVLIVVCFVEFYQFPFHPHLFNQKYQTH